MPIFEDKHFACPALPPIFFKQLFPDFAKVLRFANLFFQSA